MVKNGIRMSMVVFLLVAAIGTASAADVARFTNLGFSPDSGVFMFAQYGITHRDGKPYAEIYMVDVPGNVFVPGSVRTRVFDRSVSGGHDGSGALYTLLPELRSSVETHRVDHLELGRIVYLLVNGENEPDRSRIEFRDFRTDTRYTISVTQNARGRGSEGSAAFHLNLHVRYADGTVVERQVGRPSLYREGVNRYRVGRVIVAPDNRSLVIVMERITDVAGGRQVRYMVETVRLPRS
ncbi:MAG: DUF2259 domain-containing protein [Spirochaetaceae bacterium]|nr:MAG: DUF2259 domain-containing protein [Spirochaetaceae bacterium]